MKSNEKSNSNSSHSPKAIFKIKHAKLNESSVKTTFEVDGEEIKEPVHTFQDGNSKEVLIELEKELPLQRWQMEKALPTWRTGIRWSLHGTFEYYLWSSA